MGIIYCAQNKINGRRYIGRTILSLERRKREHEKWAETHPENKGGCTAFVNALRKYGFDAFEWTIVFDDVKDEELNDLEIETIAVYKTLVPNGYNLKEGGNAGRPSEETKRRLSDTLLSRNFKHTEDSKRKMSEAKKGKKHSFESRQKMSNVAKNRSPETRKRMSEAQKNQSTLRRPQSEETRKRKSEKMKIYHQRKRELRATRQKESGCDSVPYY